MTAQEILKAVDETVPSKKYQKEVKKLKAKPELIWKSWAFSEIHSPLFDEVADEKIQSGAAASSSDETCGCLTQIRNQTNGFDAYPVALKNNKADKSLTSAIKKDKKIPKDSGKITIEHLPRFAQWQTFLDKYYGRTA